MDLYFQYDEDLSQNLFFNKLQSEHKIILDTAPLENWIICIPRAVTLQQENLSNPNFLLSHILIPSDELPDTHFTSLLGDDINFSNKKLTNNKNIESIVLFEEVYYTKGLMKYKVWCIESPLQPNTTNSITAGIFLVRDLKDAIDLIWNETYSKAIFRKIDNSCNTFMKHTKKDQSLEKLRNATEMLYNHCLQSLILNKRLKEKCRRDLHFYKILKIALETYMMSVLYGFLFDSITICNLEECELFNKNLRKLSDVHLSHFNIDSKYNDVVACVRVELLKIEDYTTAIEKLGCLRRSLNAASRNKHKNLCIDELIPILVFVIIKSGLTHWSSTLIFLKEFVFNELTNASEKGADSYLITTLEAAITYIKSFNYNWLNEIETPLYETRSIFKTNDDFIDYLAFHIKCGNEQEVMRILKTGKDITIGNQTDNTTPEVHDHQCHPLCDCSKCSLNDCDRTPDVNTQNMHGITALHIASMFGLPKMLNLILAFGANLKAVDENNWVALHYAAARGHQNTLLLLLHAGIDINAKTNDNFTSLHLSAMNGHQGCVKALLYYADHVRAKIEINCENKMGDTSLHLAAKWGFIEIIETLIENGVSVDRINRLGHTASDLAHNSFISAQLQNVFIVIEKTHHVDVPVVINSDPFHGSIRDGLSTPKHERKKTNNDKIIAAIKNGDTKLAYYFLGVDNSIGNNQCHPLCNCKSCSENSIKDVNENNCSHNFIDIDECNSDGITPLFAASHAGNIEIMKYLIDHGASLNRSTISNQTILHLAVLNKSIETTELVLSNITEHLLNVQDNCGNTALHYAVKSGNYKLVERILRHEPDLLLQNNDKITAMDIARNCFYFNIANMLDLAENGAEESCL